METHHPTVIGTITGFVLGVFAIPRTADIESTMILAIIGAVTGFLTTLVIRKTISFVKRIMKNKDRDI